MKDSTLEVALALYVKLLYEEPFINTPEQNQDWRLLINLATHRQLSEEVDKRLDLPIGTTEKNWGRSDI